MSFVLFLLIPFYVVFINNEVTKSYYVDKLEKQIDEMEKSGDFGKDYVIPETKIFYFNSIESQKYILSILKNSYADIYANVLRFGVSNSYYINMGDISLHVYYYPPDYKTVRIELSGFHVNVYGRYDENEYLFRYLMSFYGENALAL
jgi:hypothetical protein